MARKMISKFFFDIHQINLRFFVFKTVFNNCNPKF